MSSQNLYQKYDNGVKWTVLSQMLPFAKIPFQNNTKKKMLGHWIQ